MAVTVDAAAELAEGVCAPRGFAAGAAASQVRGDGDADRLDVAVVRSELPCQAAGVFTRNLVKAAPVVISQLTLRQGRVQAVVLNSGSANACTGAQGFRDALQMCKATGDATDLDPAQVLVCSTGVIGRAMPMERVVVGIRAAAADLDHNGGGRAARAIMTTDTLPKQAVSGADIGGRRIHVGGMAKGAGMIHPDMATLLALVTTDAPVGSGALQPLLQRVAEATFMGADDRVIGVMDGATAKTYPAGILSQHGLVEDRTRSGPIAITW